MRLVLADRLRADRAQRMPMLGLLSGLAAALVLWGGIALVVVGLLR